MWAVLNGTIVNAFTVAAGSLIGLSAASRISERYRTIVLTTLGLVTVTLGVDAAVLGFADTVRKFAPDVRHSETYGARLGMVMVGSLILGAIIGTRLQLQRRIEQLGALIHARFAEGDGHRFAEGFLTASVIFCVGPLTLLGCLRNGTPPHNPDFLYIKAFLDGFCSMALAASLGWGVFASVATVLLFQGGLSLLAFWGAAGLDELSRSLMTVVGGVVLLATALLLLDLKKIPVADLLPGIFLPPAIIWLAERVSPGILLPLTAATA